MNEHIKDFSQMEVKESLKDIIVHHVIALDMSKQLQDMTKYFMLFYHLTMISAMCFVAFIISNVSDSGGSLSEF